MWLSDEVVKLLHSQHVGNSSEMYSQDQVRKAINHILGRGPNGIDEVRTLGGGESTNGKDPR